MEIFFKYMEKLLAVFICLALSPLCFAETITITGQKIIDKPTCYKDVTLNLDNGSFVVTNEATLELENTTIKGTMSPQNPFLLQLVTGQLILKNSVVEVAVSGIKANPLNPSAFYAFSILKGKVYIVGNRFKLQTPYTTGLLTTKHFDTSDFIIRYNKVYNFHGGFFLSHSHNALVSNNFFSKVSLTNILTKNGSNNVFRHNTMLLSGNNGMDVLDSSQITLSDNHIFSSSCYSIFILRSHEVLVEHNDISSGKTYAIYIAPSIGQAGAYASHLVSLVDEAPQADYKNSRITVINNYIAQNRYGLAATNVDGVEARNNIFIQHFSNSPQRKFWTNNDILLKDVLHLSWGANLYKEAYPQSPRDSTENTRQFVEFPAHGGVSF